MPIEPVDPRVEYVVELHLIDPLSEDVVASLVLVRLNTAKEALEYRNLLDSEHGTGRMRLFVAEWFAITKKMYPSAYHHYDSTVRQAS